jgi:hypothetical protein
VIDPNSIVGLDFETYFDNHYSLRSKEYNTSEYIRDPQFKVHCVGVRRAGQPTQVIWDDDVAPFLRSVDWANSTLLCHHAQFDGAILAWHYGIIPSFYLCTMSMARALHAGITRASLDAVAGYYGVGNKLPNVLSKMKGHRVIPDELRAQASAYTAMDVDLMWLINHTMLKCFPAPELKLIDLTIRLFTDPVLRVNLSRVEAELEQEMAQKDAKIAACGVDIDELMSAGKLAAALRARGVEPPTKISPRTKQIAYAFAQTDEEFLALGTHAEPGVRALVEARLAVKSTLGETRAKRFLKAGAGGQSLPVYLNYCGAHTTRWSGGNKLNLQNLPRGGELRRALEAPPGHRVVVVDSAQIEARVLAWLAGQTDLLGIFATGGDPYCAFASVLYGRTITKVDKDERFVGKVCVLGLGYQMGWRRLQGTLALGIMGPPLFLSDDVCQRAVRTYRRLNKQIKALWGAMEHVLYKMLMKKRHGTPDEVTVLRQGVIEYDGGSLWLPNGLPLHYPDLRADWDEERDEFRNFTYRSNKEFVHIYGGLLTENVVQALARVIVAEQMLAISFDWRVVTMTHDEVVCVAPEADADRCLQEMLAIMRTPPTWAPDLPLNAEGAHDCNYSK